MEEISKIPQHVSIIMDGNGRWAKSRGLERLEGHKEGVESVRACLEFAVEMKIKYLSLFAFSTENWGRPSDEVQGLWALMLKAIERETKYLVKNRVRVLMLGNLQQLDPDLRLAIEGLMEATSGGQGTTLVVMINYSGKWDIVQAANRFAEENPGRQMLPEDFDKYLITAGVPDPDLLIRTSGEERISNYMLWQTAYTEFYFTDTLWPDFRKKEFRLAIEEFAKRDRRFGKVKSNNE
ncbi:MAG: di-trans,poly-cis-decaprenylcistransferase [Bacteroidales bacterium]|jgi:undecaprenyl diphosphate synthase|nr:di-trans,poly-cis-decaprenylcistransferase [Bacteroidales bacterium]MBR0314725.1 di-trans,poly-cis-decaprenylcistransferase [Bacteroidales bacterium]MBR6971325.1 di-trans,poly-cis-decaprenylcistransferase [Bacteroidales bacterium]